MSPTEEEEYSIISDFKPRDYQLRCFENAKKENILAFLETGTGKTFISVMLIKHVAQQSDPKSKKLTFFLVNLVPLVLQQAYVLRQHTYLRVGHYTGEMDVDMWSLETWNHLFDQLDVIVMTAQILLHLLNHGFVRMEQINLIVIDECHHARKRHPYNIIMQEFYFTTPKTKRPKIFGMSASPLDHKGDFSEGIKGLENNLDSKAFTITRNECPDLNVYAPKPEEYVVQYDIHLDHSKGPLYTKFLQDFSDFKYSKMLNFVDKIWNELGSWFVERLLFLKFMELSQLNYEDLIDNNQSSLFLGLKLSKFSVEDFLGFQKAAQGYEKIQLISPDDENVRDKVKNLVKVLLIAFERDQDTFCCLLFVQTRISAMLLDELMRHHPQLKKIIRSKAFFGRSSTSTNIGSKMKLSTQRDILKMFRNRELNMLVSTNVAEEGLDIQICSLVIRFDLFQTYISYVQSRGRARHLTSRYVIFIEKYNDKQTEILKKVRDAEFDLEKWREHLKEQETLLIEQNKQEDDELDDLIVSEDNKFYSVPTTGASISLNSSISLLSHYLSVKFSGSQKIDFQLFSAGLGLFSCRLNLDSIGLVLESQPATTKAYAKRSVALEAIAKLHQQGELNDHLLPPAKVQNKSDKINDPMELLIGMDVSEEILPYKDSMKVDREWTASIAEINGYWQNILSAENQQITLYLHFFDLNDVSTEEYHPLGMILPLVVDSIADFPVYLETLQEGREIPKNISFKFIKEINISLEQLEHYRKFNGLIHRYAFLNHRKFLNYKNNRPNYLWDDQEMSKFMDLQFTYLFVPVNQSKNDIDMEMVQYIFDANDLFHKSEHKDVWSLYKQLNQKQKNYQLVGTDIIDYQKRFWVQKIDHDHLVNTKMGSLEKDFAKEYSDLSFKEFYQKKFPRIPYYKLLPEIDDEQPLFVTRPTPLLRNYLIPNYFTTQRQYPSRLPSYRIPQFMVFIPFPANFFNSLMLIPSLVSNFEALWTVNRFQENCELVSQFPKYLLLEALTCPGTNLGYSYERLETLGDSFMKIAVSLDLFLKYPDKQEGSLSYIRHLLVSNKSLYYKAIKINLPSFIIYKAINTKYWKSSSIYTKDYKIVSLINTTKEEKVQLNIEQEYLSDSTIADVAESLIGAAFIHGGIDTGLKMLKLFGIVTTTDSFDEFKKLLKVYFEDKFSIPRSPLIRPEVFDSKFHYRFKHSELLSEALNHSSSSSKEHPSYERLEYLGDAVLDFIVCKKLFSINTEDQDPNLFPRYIPSPATLPVSVRKSLNVRSLPLDPGLMTEFKALIVSNETLCFISVFHQLQSFIQHHSLPFFQSVTKYSEWLDEGLVGNFKDLFSQTNLPWWWFQHLSGGENDLFYNQKLQALIEYQNEITDDETHSDCQSEKQNIISNGFDFDHLKKMTKEEFKEFLNFKVSIELPPAPKIISDVLEALIGACFIDSDLDLQVAKKFIDSFFKFSPQKIEYTPKEKTLLPENIEDDLEMVKIELNASFDQWMLKSGFDCLNTKMHPTKKLLEWFESRKCQGLVIERLPFKKKDQFNLMGAEQPIAPIKFSDFFTYEDLKKNITKETTPFLKPAIAIYLHGFMIAYDESHSYKNSQIMASKIAILNLEKMIENGISFGPDHSIIKDPPLELSISYGHPCYLCKTSQ